MGNCFRVRGFVYGRSSRDLVQFEGTGTLFEVLAQLVYYTNKFNDQIQVVIIEQVLDADVCIESEVFEDLSTMVSDPGIDLKEEEKKLREHYDSIYRSEYKPPKVKLEYEGNHLKRIIIERGDGYGC